MEKYRKSDQYYVEQYDRWTIEDLKEKEAKMLKAHDAFEKANGVEREKLLSEYLGLRMRYNDSGANSARNKRALVQEAIQADENRDRRLESARTPNDIRCKTCLSQMILELHDFIGTYQELVFFFTCPNGHKPRRAIYADGREYVPPKSKCNYCGGSFSSKRKRIKNKLIFTETCKSCGKVETIELDTSRRKISPINEEERKKYCTDFIGRRTFEEDVKALADLSLIMKELEQSSLYGIDKIQQLNIVQLEELVRVQVEKSGFIKLQFEKPKTGRYLTMEFSVHDPTGIESEKSIKKLKRLIETTLFPTNWRLMSPGIECQLGFLSGKLKGFSLQEDLITIAKEISESQPK